jgi:uncharacterized protein YjbJ (UPF0337 family)
MERRNTRDRDRGEGHFEQSHGSLKKGLGRLTGDRKTQAEGHIDKAKGGAGQQNDRLYK